jgi:putative ABC transport system permease protein
MMEKLPDLNLLDLVAMGGLVAIASGGLLWLRVKLWSQLWLGAARATLQTLMLGIFFTFLSRSSQPLASWLGAAALLLVAAVATSSRLGKSWQQLLLLVTGILLLSTGLVTGYIYLVIGQGRWPMTYLPILVGLLMAASPPVLMAVGGNFLSILQQEQSAIATRLSLGATASQWLIVYQRRALGQSLTPVLQSLALQGLVTLPSLMAGLMLTGVTPLTAAGYQVVVTLAIVSQQMMAAVMLLLGLGWLSQDAAGRLIAAADI